MENEIKKLYEMLYSPIITPYNLLENAKLDNYSYVNYYKGKDGLIAEMKCKMDNYKEVIFYYEFDNNDRLNKIFMEDGNERVLKFDRTLECKQLQDSINSKHKKQKEAI